MESYGESCGDEEGGGCAYDGSWAWVYYVVRMCLVCHWVLDVFL